LPDESIRSSVIAIADFTRRYLIEAYKIPAEKVALIYQGTDTERFRHSKRALKEAKNRYPIQGNASPILGSIGSFEPRKGHPVLFEALVEVAKNALPDVHLMMVGDGPDESKLRKMAKSLGLGRNVSFFPFTDEPNYIYEQLDMTILPSLNKEGLPNVLLESMSMGVPVVSSNIGGIPEIVIDGETGFMVEPGNIPALADAIIKVWGNQANFQEMKVKARKLIVDQFDKHSQFNKFASHFQSLIETN
jgi:glycosyltransferase involved in cell wall biosynthesis